MKRKLLVFLAAGLLAAGFLTGYCSLSSAAEIVLPLPAPGALLLAHFDEGAGNPKDSSGNGNNGIMAGDAGWVAEGKFGAAAGFNGTGYVNFGRKLRFREQDFALEVWIKTGSWGQSSPFGTILSNDDGGTPYYSLGVTPENKLTFSVRDAQKNSLVLSDTVPVNDNQWHHVRVTRQGWTFSLYRDGRLVDAKNTPPIGSIDSSSLGEHWTGAIPDRGGRWFFRGTVDEISIIGEEGMAEKKPLLLGAGPHLFLGDHLIEKTSNLKKLLHQPEKFAGNPIAKGGQEPTPELEREAIGMLLYDAQNKLLRRWYSVAGTKYSVYFAYAEAPAENLDRINWAELQWKKPALGLVPFMGDKNNNLMASGLFIGTDVLYDPDCGNPAERYKMFYWPFQAPSSVSRAVSPDGLHWDFQGVVPDLKDGASDIMFLLYDRVNKEYVGIFKQWGGGGSYAQIKMRDGSTGNHRRVIGLSRSKDFKTWTQVKRLLQPDDLDHPKAEFYGLVVKDNTGGTPRFIGFLPILVDDVVDAPPDGIGWTQMAVSQELDRWNRIRETFLPRSEDNPDAFDHSFAWVSSVLDGDSKTYVFYHGYQQGHKIGRRTGGVAFLRLNGYASLDAGREPGTLRTNQVILPAGRNQLALNAAVRKGGTLLVQLSDEKGAIPGYAFSDCTAVKTDAVSIPVSWQGKKLLPAAQEPLRLEFRLVDAALYGFSFQPGK